MSTHFAKYFLFFIGRRSGKSVEKAKAKALNGEAQQTIPGDNLWLYYD